MNNSLGQKLFKEYANYYGNYLKSQGLNLSKIKKDEKILLGYFNWTKKQIARKERTVMKSKEFHCPTNLKSNLNEIEMLLKTGGDLSGHLSKNSVDLLRHDDLLYDWGIHHLHFKSFKLNGESKGRTKELLYIYVTDDSAYLIDVKSHNDFCNEELLEIIDANWPHITEAAYTNGSDYEYSTKISSLDRKRLRKAKINIPTVLKNGKALLSMMIGGGIASSGDSSDAAHQVLNIQRNFDEIGDYLHKVINDNYDELLNPIFNKSSKFCLVTAENAHGCYEWAICDENTGRGASFNSLLDRALLLEGNIKKLEPNNV